MVGTQVMTQSDLTVVLNKKASIAVSAAPMQAGPVQRVIDGDNVKNEGTFFANVLPYQITYRALLPKASQCQTLIVPVCVSASYVAYSSLSDEVTRMSLGQAAGTAAALAATKSRTI